MKPEGWLATRSGALAAWLAAFICCGIAGLAWLGYRAAEEWHDSSAQLVDRRTREIVDLLTTAVTRDMRAVQVSILDGREWDGKVLSAPYEMIDTVQAAFARYPYPEVFFACCGYRSTGYFFVRSDRRPAWLPASTREDTYPVEILPSPPVTSALLARIERELRSRNQYGLFEITIAGVRYQVVTRMLYDDATRDRPAGVFGFIVDLNWIRRNYFSSITEQVALIARTDEGVDYAILDEEDRPIVGAAPAQHGNTATRRFPVLFFDPALVAGGPPADLPVRSWSVTVNAGRDPTLAIAARGARRTLIVVGAAALALGLGLVITVRASRAAAATAVMRSDFVSTVTHALKTPVSVIRGIGETLIRGRVGTPDRLREYAQLLVQEGHRLTRLIDNMLAYARVTDAANVYLFEPHPPAEIIDEVMKGFQRLLADGQFETSVAIDAGVPLVRADRVSLVLALDNLVDNAMRYGGQSRSLSVTVRAVERNLEFAVVDRGEGISPDDLARVTHRFARGRSATGHGSGLGLAIANRIANDHGGRLRVESALGVGTTVTLVIPASA